MHFSLLLLWILTLPNDENEFSSNLSTHCFISFHFLVSPLHVLNRRTVKQLAEVRGNRSPNCDCPFCLFLKNKLFHRGRECIGHNFGINFSRVKSKEDFRSTEPSYDYFLWGLKQQNFKFWERWGKVCHSVCAQSFEPQKIWFRRIAIEIGLKTHKIEHMWNGILLAIFFEA